MKQKLVYIIAFVFAFAVTTGAIYYLNMNYRNIFKLDFTPLHKAQKNQTQIKAADLNVNELKDFISTKLKSDIIDSLKTIYASTQKTDTVFATQDNKPLADSLKKLQSKLKQLQQELSLNAKQETAKLNENNNRIDSSKTYQEWTRKTAGIFAAMDARKAAKIISNYSDNVARDILFAMKKKSAAQIMSELSPEVVSRISREQ